MTQSKTDSDNSRGRKLQEIVRISQLADIYGNLLTERQFSSLSRHFEDDESFGEIARVLQVSRQAVHDSVKQATAALENYDEKLGLLERQQTLMELSGELHELAGQIPAIAQRLHAIAQKIEDTATPPSVAHRTEDDV
ncbi:MAG: DNA-binding protein [Sumerlaeia bacterium]